MIEKRAIFLSFFFELNEENEIAEVARKVFDEKTAK